MGWSTCYDNKTHLSQRLYDDLHVYELDTKMSFCIHSVLYSLFSKNDIEIHVINTGIDSVSCPEMGCIS